MGEKATIGHGSDSTSQRTCAGYCDWPKLEQTANKNSSCIYIFIALHKCKQEYNAVSSIREFLVNIVYTMDYTLFIRVKTHHKEFYYPLD